MAWADAREEPALQLSQQSEPALVAARQSALALVAARQSEPALVAARRSVLARAQGSTAPAVARRAPRHGPNWELTLPVHAVRRPLLAVTRGPAATMGQACVPLVLQLGASERRAPGHP
jgi:hypothetical protein